MGGGSWKVAYADFMTAMMAFFLLMWLLNIADPETKKGLSDYFTPGASGVMRNVSSSVIANNNIMQYVDKLDTREFVVSEVESSNYAIAQALKDYALADSLPSPSSGVTTDGLGVLLQVTSNLMFEPNSAVFTPAGEKILSQVIDVMHKYKVYLVVRGHCDSSETGEPNYPSKWELSSARANAAVRYLIDKGINPSYVRSVAYADTRPRVPPDLPNSVEMNSRVEFNFHRPEVMSTIVGY